MSKSRREPSYTIASDGRSITCHVCGKTSHHPKDITERYCGNCHAFHDALQIWIVYDHPRDYPDSFVARLFLTDRPTNVTITANTLEALRAELQRRGLVCIARDPNDDPKIVESWL